MSLPIDVTREVLIREEGVSDERYGKPPPKRSVEELLDAGIINLDKPPGPTSHEVVAWVKRILNLDRAGHAGTLDSPN